MTDGIGRIFGGNSYGVGGYVPQGKGNESEEDAPQVPVNNYDDTQVDPSKVMDFLAQNNYFVNLTNAPEAVEGVVPDPALQARVDGYMQNFELIYSIVEQEFGPELAPVVMDMVMDRLMGMFD